MRRTVVKNHIEVKTRIRAIALSVGIVLALSAATACGSGEQPDQSAGDSQSDGASGDTTQDGGEAEVAEISMPSVIDKNAAVAEDELEKLGFTAIELGSVDSENDTLGVVNPANWTVKEQSHKKGEKVAADATIVLGCVKNS